ncbi:hypothetical protein [Neorhodopirellula pilleata]|uniref:Secreted protein n=1 Tax=Neorhodopirellula pilleata TaxID=2714738 RepID=A0A5C6AEG2_9BACT|nr:hypothetical protein [Neorhodopirellula pilleata]TWT97461.1 hypothetical protein Pla100_26150 [Neorhodopirellula pilleata]
MKIVRHDRNMASLFITLAFWLATVASAQTVSVSHDPSVDDHGTRLLGRVIERLALGAAFDAKVRQRVWVGGREVIGVGTYEQAGDGSGRFNLQVAMHDGDGKHTLQQISDGRLAWTREQIGDQILLQRVDVGRLDQWVHGATLTGLSRAEGAAGSTRSIVGHLPPSVRVGGFVEMLETMVAQHDLRVVTGRLEDQDVWIVRGSLKDNVRLQMLANFPNNQWPELCPDEMVVAIAKSDQIDTGFGQGIPVRIEFWVSPPTGSLDDKGVENQTGQPATMPKNRMVSLIELYSIRPISTPPIGRFRFENQDMEVNYTNDTDRYLHRYGIEITERQSRLLRR